MKDLTDLLKFYEAEKLKFKNAKKIKQSPNQDKKVNKPSEGKFSSGGLFFDIKEKNEKSINIENNNKKTNDDSDFLL